MDKASTPPQMAQTFVTRISALVQVLEREHKQLSVCNLWTEGARLISLEGFPVWWTRCGREAGPRTCGSLQYRRLVTSLEQSEGLGDALQSRGVQTQEVLYNINVGGTRQLPVCQALATQA